jgi:hypothetical protein
MDDVPAVDCLATVDARWCGRLAGGEVKVNRFQLSAFATAGAVLGPKRLPTIGRQPSGEIFVTIERALAGAALLHHCKL